MSNLSLIFSSWGFPFLRYSMSSSGSAALLCAVDNFPLAFLTDCRALCLIFPGLFVFKTACLGSMFGEPPLPLPVSAVETCTLPSPV